MNDFETCPRGTMEELRLSRELALAISQEVESWGEVVPRSVMQAYNRLWGFHIKQMQNEEYEQGNSQETPQSDS